MQRRPSTTARVSINCQSFSRESIQGKVWAGNFEWQFTWEFGKGELTIEPPLGRALIKDSLERFLVKDDYKLEVGENYMFTIKAKF